MRVVNARWIIALCLALVSLLSLSKHSALAQAVDHVRFCNDEAETVIILIDVTTKFDDRAIQLFSDGADKITSELTGGQRLVVLSIEDTFTHSTRLYEGCIPYCEAKSGVAWIGDVLFGNCTAGVVRLKSREQRQTISAILRDKLSKSTDLPYSEIVRTLAYSLRPITRQSTSSPVHLYIFSDLIENSEFLGGRVFLSQKPEKTIQLLATNDLIPQLSKAKVRAFGIGRSGDTGRRTLPEPMLVHIKRFWDLYFRTTGATDVVIDESFTP
jgi:hypothetical protein